MSHIEELRQVFPDILEKIKKNCNTIDNYIPKMVTDEKYLYQPGGGGWTDGFFPGILNLAFSITGDESFFDKATKLQDFFELRVQNNAENYKGNDSFLLLDHDTGFIFTLSQVARYKLKGDTAAREMALSAADILAARFNEAGKFIRAFDEWKWDTDPAFIEEKKGKVIIDSMMNIPLLLWAYCETGKQRYQDIACSHADTVLRYIVREDYSTYHQCNFNHLTGEYIKGVTGQGYADESCWSRGQAWAIYGFAIIYEYTNDSKYLEASRNLADYFITHLGADMIPCWDFDVSHLPFAPWDSSAGAIAASGILELAKHSEEKDYYREIAANMLSALTNLCSGLSISSGHPLLLHGCAGPVFQKNNHEKIIIPYIDTPLIFGDYFYLEALDKLLHKNEKLFW